MRRIIELVDWAARAHFVGTTLWGGGVWAVTFFGASLQGWDATSVWLASLIAGACAAVIFLAIKARPINAVASDDTTRNLAGVINAGREPTLDGNIDARKAFFQILESSQWKKDQEAKTTDTRQLVGNWLEVRLRTEIHKALRNSRLTSWGEECLQGTATTPEKPIPAEAWDKIEIDFDRTALPRTAAHFKGFTSLEKGRMAWVGIRFSSDQIFQMFPLNSQADGWKPICFVIQHISERIGDNDTSNCFEKTRQQLRQAAYDKRVRIRGRKQLPQRRMSSGPDYANILTDVDKEYWTISEINALATSPDFQRDYHVDPQTAFAWGPKGIDERNRYYDLHVNWADVLREWP